MYTLLPTGRAMGLVLHTHGPVLRFVAAAPLVPGLVPGTQLGLHLCLLSGRRIKRTHPAKGVVDIYPPSTFSPKNYCQVRERGDTQMDPVQAYEKHCETHNREGSVRICQRETQTQTR